MWTPRRLLLFLLGFALCLGAYQIYAFFLGHYDGLPPLPSSYRPSAQSSAKDDNSYEQILQGRKHEIEKMLERAFGPKSQPIRLSNSFETGEPHNKKVFAFSEWKLIEGKLKLTDVSVANFIKHPKTEAQPEREEIITLQGEVVWIEFNEKVKSISDIKKGTKPIAGYIEGKEIVLTHNRSTPDLRTDDITIYCKKRIDFVDDQHRIWSDEKVLVVVGDLEYKFEGVGLTINLVSDLLSRQDKSTGPTKEKNSRMDLGMVKSITLDHDVQFSFFKLQGNFLGKTAGPPPQKAATPTSGETDAPQNVQPLVVSCKDAFIYDVVRQTATFHRDVKALRHRTEQTAQQLAHRFDELDADEKLVLELQTAKAKPDKASQETPPYELKRASATGKLVKLTVNEDSQGRGIKARGVEMVWDNVTNEAWIKGKPQVVAEIQDYQLVTPGKVSLLLAAPADASKEIKGLKINGPGEVHQQPSADHPEPYPLASWQRELQWHRTAPDQRIELYGSAVFMHEKLGRLMGDQVKVWLDDKKQPTLAPSLENKPPPKGDPLESVGAQHLKRLEAEGLVSLLSPQLVIPKARKLHVNFVDAPEGFVPQRQSDQPLLPANPSTQPGILGKPTTRESTPPPQAKAPYYLHADNIDADILMMNSKFQAIRRLHAEENVHLERRPEPGKQNGLDIRGQRIEMTSQDHIEQYRFKLFGNKALIQTEKFSLEGKQIDLDQAENTAIVPGPGRFRFLTDKNFQGSQLKQPQQIVFTWDEQMSFGGKVAIFLGNVQTEIESECATVSCQKLTATLDKTISFRVNDGQPNHQVVGLETLICQSNNRVVIEQRIKPGTYERHLLRIEGVQVVFDNMAKGQEKFQVFGPGELNLVRAGTVGSIAPIAHQARSDPPAAPKNTRPLMLTRVYLEEEMMYRNLEKELIFSGNVRAFYVPGEDIAMQLDEKRLPKDGLFMGAKELKIGTLTTQDKRTVYDMRATNNVIMRANNESYVKGQALSFDETKGILRIKGNPAKLYRQSAPGAPYDSMDADGFEYDRNTGEFRSINTRSIQFK